MVLSLLSYLHIFPLLSFTSSSCTFVPPSVLSICMLEKCLFACCKTCVDKYQLQVNDTVYEHWRFFLPFSFHEDDNAWKEGKNGIRILFFFPLHVPHMVVFSTYKGLIQAICTHHTLLKTFMTNVAAVSPNCWSVSLNMGHIHIFCASLSRDTSQSLSSRYSRKAEIASCLNLSAKQQSNTMFLFQLTFLNYRNSWARSEQAGMSTQWTCLAYLLDLSTKAV